MASTPAGVAVPHASRAPAVGTVASVEAHEAEVRLAEGGRAILPLDQVCAEPISHVGERLKVDDKVIGLVTHVGQDAVTLSMKEYQRFSIQQMLTPSQQPRTVSRKTNPSSRQQPEDGERNLSGKAGGKKIPDDLWREIERDHPVGSRLSGKVTNIMPYGAFVEVRPGIQGLVHNSEMAWRAPNAVASEHVKIGDQVEVTVLKLDQENCDIYLSIKRCLPNPWQEFKDKHAQGSKFTGTVSSCSEEHGLFVTLPGGLNGMVAKHMKHGTNKDWRELIDDYGIGDSINVSLVGVKVDKQWIYLAVNQHNKYLHEQLAHKLRTRTPVKGKVVEVLRRKAVVNIGEGIEAALPLNEISDEFISLVSESLEVGDEVEALLTLVKDHEVRISIKQLERMKNGIGQDGDAIVKAHRVVEAQVLEIKDKWVIIDIGQGSPKRLLVNNLREKNGTFMVKPGGRFNVIVETIKESGIVSHISYLPYPRESWELAVSAAENNTTIRGVVREQVENGYLVDIKGLRAFLPTRLAELDPQKQDNPDLVGQTEAFFVDRYNCKSITVVLNRRLVQEHALFSGDFNSLDFGPGDRIQGKVAVLIDDPDSLAHVDLGGGIHGRLHSGDLSWRRIKRISEELEVDQELEVVVLEFNHEENYIKLGVKQLTQDPWIELEKTYPAGSRIIGTVTGVEDYGAFVEIEKGIEGLVHTSEMDWQHRNVNANNYAKVGDSIEVMMLDLNKDKRRIWLSIKQCQPNPWEEFKVTYRPGSKLRGKVTSRSEDLGLFVELPGGLTGLVHKSNMTYGSSWRDEFDKYQVDDAVDVSLIEVDINNQRVSLGIKQLGANPYEIYEDKARSRQPVTGKVSKIKEKSALVDIGDGIEAILPIGEICEERINAVEEKIKVGDEVEALVARVEKRTVVLSIKALVLAKERDELRRQVFNEDGMDHPKSLGMSPSQPLGITSKEND